MFWKEHIVNEVQSTQWLSSDPSGHMERMTQRDMEMLRYDLRRCKYVTIYGAKLQGGGFKGAYHATRTTGHDITVDPQEGVLRVGLRGVVVWSSPLTLIGEIVICLSTHETATIFWRRYNDEALTRSVWT